MLEQQTTIQAGDYWRNQIFITTAPVAGAILIRTYIGADFYWKSVNSKLLFMEVHASNGGSCTCYYSLKESRYVDFMILICMVSSKPNHVRNKIADCIPAELWQ